MPWRIDSRRHDLIEKWFDEVMPLVNPSTQPDVPPAQIRVDPLWSDMRPDAPPDWLTDNRVLGRMHDFPARSGREAMRLLERLRGDLMAELASIKLKAGR